MINLLHVHLKFERGNGDFRTVLDFFCENFEVIGDASMAPSIYRFEYIYDKDPYLPVSEHRPMSEVLETDNNRSLLDYWQYTDEDKINNWMAEIESNYVTTLAIEPVLYVPDTSIKKEN